MAEQHYDGPAIQINPASAYAAEMRKWESTYTMYGAPGRPFVYVEYPRDMFLAGHPDGRPGKIEILHGSTRTVHSDAERSAAERDGYDADQHEAIKKQKDRDREMARAAAAQNFADRRMSEKALTEKAEVEDATAEHVADVPRANPKTGKRTIE
jgi:hypothetical protein